MLRSERVSDPTERLILVDGDDRPVGTLPKRDCHLGDGVLHRAFSIFIFNTDGDVLLQQRGRDKPLWPLYWSNACCSHPRDGESLDEALERRLLEELGIRCPLTFLFKFQYQAYFEDVGAEHELCSVFAGRHDGPFDANSAEIAALRSIDPQRLTAELESSPDEFTPWLAIEWRRIRAEHADVARTLVPG